MPLYNQNTVFALDRRQTFKIVTSFGDMKHYSIYIQKAKQVDRYRMF